MDDKPGLSIRGALQWATATLACQSDNPALESELLLAHTLQRERSHLHAWPERSLANKEHQVLEALVTRRLAGEPLAYLLEEREFWSLLLHVKSGVLIPRNETEELVRCALAHLPTDQKIRIADLGTGAGGIALALATERPNASIVAVDRSETAISIARQNARRLGVNNIQFIISDWLSAIADNESYDMLISNPPYIAESDPHLESGDLPAEPPEALIAGELGLDAIQRISACSQPYLRAGGWILFEHGYNQGNSVRALLVAAGYTDIRTSHDLEARERVTEGRRL